MSSEQDERLATAHARLQMMRQWSSFLESTPAYVERHFENLIGEAMESSGGVSLGIYCPRLQLYCETDDGLRGFDSGDKFITVRENKTVVTRYTCRDCASWHKTFALILAPDRKAKTTLIAMKLGEYPPFGSHLAKRLQKMLSETDLDLYRKGLRAEREGQGIGSAAYFRRVVENQWKNLVTKLRDAAAKLGTPAERLTVFDDALTETQFSAAVTMLKDAIPAKLLILDGRNPLTLLHRPLSVQLHGLTDEECLQQAADIRIVLNELFDNISRVLKDDQELRGAVNRLQSM